MDGPNFDFSPANRVHLFPDTTRNDLRYILSSMKQNSRLLIAIFAACLMAAPAFAMPSLYSVQSASQDMKNAGQDSKDAAKDAGNGTKKGTKKAWHSTKKGTKKAYNKTKSTTQGAVDGGKQGAKQPQ